MIVCAALRCIAVSAAVLCRGRALPAAGPACSCTSSSVSALMVHHGIADYRISERHQAAARCPLPASVPAAYETGAMVHLLELHTA